MFSLKNIFKTSRPSIEEIAQILKTDRATLEKIEENYRNNILSNDKETDNLFEISAKSAISMNKANAEKNISPAFDCDDIVNRIVDELLSKSVVYQYSQTHKFSQSYYYGGEKLTRPRVSLDEILEIPPALRPQLTGYLMSVDIGGEMSYHILLDYFKKYLTEKNEKVARQYYHRFRQGLDILDLDKVTYEIIRKNPNSIGYWLPKIADKVTGCKFFTIPSTKIIYLPMPLLQLTRKDYKELTPTTLRIVNEFCRKICNLDLKKDYFIKTGTYSSKFDFRNAHVAGESEVETIGEYLLYIHYQALCMAHTDLSGRKQPVTYGVSTTTDWCIREYVKDKENALTIYNGLPLHPEYRVFVDFDAKTILGIHNYWDEKKILPHLKNLGENNPSEKNLHDYVTFSAESERLNNEYEKHKNLIASKVLEFVKYTTDLRGQWSIDIMQNKDDFWFIDMALAENSTYYNESVPIGLRNPWKEDWMPLLDKG